MDRKKLNSILNLNDILIHICFGIWFVMAAWFWQERLYGDAGFYIAKVVDYEMFRLDLGRYVMVFSQWLPLLLIKLNCSLKAVLIGYSIGHVLFFYFIYGLGRFYFKNHQMGWLVLGMQTLGMGYAFSTQSFELYYTAGWTIILLLSLLENKRTWASYLWLMFLTCFLVVNYQLIVLVLAVIGGLYWYRYKWSNYKSYLMLGLGALVGIIIKQYFLVFGYEQERAQDFVHNLMHYDWSMEHLINLFSFLWKFYYDLLLLLLITTVIYIRKKQFLHLGSYWIFILAALFVATLSFPGIAHTRYQEQCYFLWIFIVILPLFFDILPTLKKQRWWLAAFVVLFLFRFGVISQSMEIFTQRVELMHRLIGQSQKLEGNKFIIKEKNVQSTVVHPFFTFSMETMLLSGAFYPKTVNIALDSYINHGKNAQKLKDKNWYISTKRGYYDQADSLYQHMDCNSRYYDFQPSLYQRLNTAQPKLEVEKLAQTLNLIPIAKETYPCGKNINIPIQIENKSHQNLPSTKILLVYRWWKDGKMLNLPWQGYQNPLEVNILPQQNYQQPIRVHTPKEVGKYELQIIPLVDKQLLKEQYSKRISIHIK